MDGSQVYRFIFDSLMVYWFFLPLKKEKSSPARELTGAVLLIFQLPIYLYTDTGSPYSLFIRFLLRFLVYAFWVGAVKGVSYSKSLYFGALCWIAFTCENNIFLTPQLSIVRWNLIAYTDSPYWNVFINRALEWVLVFFFITLVSRTVPLNKINKITRSRAGLAAALIACELYVKYSLKIMTTVPSELYPKELTIYPVLMQLLVITALILFERYLYHRKMREEERLNEAINRYRYENALTRLNADDDLRQLYHDMKNHLVALKSLLDSEHNANAYLQHMMAGLESYEGVVETGNKILNGLIAEKLQIAAKHQIDLNACFDFRDGSFLDDMDVCAIFGNALDNAIEASIKVSDPEKRSILVKSHISSGNLIITFSNYYEGALTGRTPIPDSTKTGRMHGIGLNSILKTAQKYGGAIAVNTDEFHNFILTVLIPIPQNMGASLS